MNTYFVAQGKSIEFSAAQIRKLASASKICRLSVEEFVRLICMNSARHVDALDEPRELTLWRVKAAARVVASNLRASAVAAIATQASVAAVLSAEVAAPVLGFSGKNRARHFSENDWLSFAREARRLGYEPQFVKKSENSKALRSAARSTLSVREAS